MQHMQQANLIQLQMQQLGQPSGQYEPVAHGVLPNDSTAVAPAAAAVVAVAAPIWTSYPAAVDTVAGMNGSSSSSHSAVTAGVHSDGPLSPDSLCNPPSGSPPAVTETDHGSADASCRV